MLHPSPAGPRTSIWGGARWRVRLLGSIELDDGERRVTRLPSRAVTALLARLALWPDRLHAREELVESLWPGVDLRTGRNRLRQALSVLKSQLESPAWPAFIVADRAGVRVTSGAIACDVCEFEQALRAGDVAKARHFYRGELMPGHYDDWIGDERLRLEALAQRLGQAPTTSDEQFPHRAMPPSAHAIRDLDRPPLPSYLTRTFGSEVVTLRLIDEVRRERLVTLTGPGGSGKTRLAVEVASRLRDPVPCATGTVEGPGFDVVAFVPLVACTEVEQVSTALGTALRLPGQVETTAAGLVQALQGRRALIVLDNFEQLVDAGNAWVRELLSMLPHLHMLVTSRRPLALDGEREILMAPLALPARSAQLAQACDNPCVALFVDRARAVRADFHLGPRNLRAIVDLMHALEGMPLSIELAASRVRAQSVEQMSAGLSRTAAGDEGATPTLDLLERTGLRSGLDARHASMRRTIEWSWHQLERTQQDLLRRLTVFAASFDAAAACVLVGDVATRTPDQTVPLEVLASHSLLRIVSGDEPIPRFALYEPVREFAAETVDHCLQRQLRSRLRRWLTAWSSSQARSAPAATFHPWRPDILASLRTAVSDGEAHAALELALALRPYLDSEGLPLAGMQDLEQALAAARVADASGVAFDSHELLAYLRFGAGFVDQAMDHARAALALAGDDPSRRARAMVRLAWTQLASHRAGPELEAGLREALALASASANLETQALALHQLAIVARYHGGGLAEAESMLARAQSLWETVGDRRKAFARLLNRAQCWHAMGRTEQALTSLLACEAAARVDGDALGTLDASLALGAVLASRRRWLEAAQANTRCIELCWHRHHAHGLGYALWNQARVLARMRRPEDAGRLIAFAAQFWVQRFGPLGQGDDRYLRRVEALVCRQLGAARAEVLSAEGRTMSLADAVALART